MLRLVQALLGGLVVKIYEKRVRKIKAHTSTKKILWLVTFGHFSTDFYNGFLSPLLPLIVARLNLSLTLAGILLSIFSISNSLIQPITGILADRVGRKYLILFGPLITAFFMGLIGWVNQYWILIVILIMSGIGTAMFHPAAAAMVGEQNNHRKGLAMSIFNMAGALGVSLGALIIIPWTNKFGLRSTAYMLWIAIFFTLFSFRSISRKEAVPATSQRRLDFIQTIKPHLLLVINLFLIVVIRAIIVLTFAGFIPLYVTSQGQSAMFGGLALAIFQFFTTIGILFGGHIFDQIGTKKTLALSFIFVLPFALVFINLPSAWGLPFLAVMGLFLSSSTPVNIIVGQELIPSQASFMSSIMMGLGWGSAGLFMFPIGILANTIGLYWTLTIVSSLAIVGLMLVFCFRYEPLSQED